MAENSKNKIKNICLISISAFVALFNIFSLFFSLVCVSAFGTDNKANGFSVFDAYPAVLEECIDLLTIYSVLHILLSIAVIVATIVGIVVKKGEMFPIISMITNGTSALMAFIYMICGFIAKSTARTELDNFGGITTSAFIPFIIIAIFVAAFFVIRFLNFDKIFAGAGESKIDNEMESLKKIEKYKALLDQGVITQEEFEEKKNQLFNN